MATRIPISNELIAKTKEAVAPPPLQVEKTVYVRLDDEATRAKVTRDGYQFPALEPEEALIKDYIDKLPRLEPHVLRQTPKAGTKVPRGTVVEITMGYGGDLPVGTFVGSHLSLAAVKVDELYEQFLGDQTLRVAVSRDSDVRNWRPEERAVLMQRLQEREIPVDEADTARNAQAVVNALVVANTYGFKG
jgi:hypothetical protein